MLSFLASKMRRMPTLATQARSFHQSALHAQKRSTRLCPESQVPGCRVLKQQRCKPPEPIRTCQESKCKIDSCKLSGSPCSPSGKKRRTPFQSMWESYDYKKVARPEVLWQYPEECCPPCEDVRFDVLYYKPSDKCREYQRTWWECCPRLVPKQVCCWCDAKPPQIERRRPQACTKTVCPQGPQCQMDKRCLRVRMPCCRASRFPPSCNYYPPPADCVKVRCPFPSYSECLQEDPAVIAGRAPECKCQEVPPLCVQFRRANHMAKHNISLYPCCR